MHSFGPTATSPSKVAAYVIASLVLVLAPAGCARRSTHLPLHYWHWHRPFEVSSAQQSELETLGVESLWVFVGELLYDGEEVAVRPGQEWRTQPEMPVVLVFRLDVADCCLAEIDDFIAPPEGKREQLAEAITARIMEHVEQARERGAKVVGVQLDFDCPTRLLKDYAKTLAALRIKLKDLELSITALPSWLGDSAFRDVAGQVDSYALMLYGLKTPLPLRTDDVETIHRVDLRKGTLPAITDVGSIRQYIKQADRIGKPYVAGLASFGYALRHMDGRADLIHGHTWRDLLDRERHLLEPTDSGWERQLRFKSDEFMLFGTGDIEMSAPRDITFVISEPGRLREAYREVRRSARSHLAGIAFFRVPAGDEPLVLSPRRVRRALGYEKLQVDLAPSLTVVNVGTSRLVEISVKNRGLAGTRPGKESLVLEVHLSPAGAEMADPGEFAGYDCFLRSNGRTLSSSLRRANTLRFRSLYLEPGGAVSTGPLLLANEDARIRVSLHYLDPVSGKRVTKRATQLKPAQDVGEVSD